MSSAQVQLSLQVQDVLRDARQAFLDLCIDAGQKVPAAMMEAGRIALCGPRGAQDLPVVMIDGIHFRDHVILPALGIGARGHRHVQGLREGYTEATRVVASPQARHPGGAGSLREGLEEMAAVARRPVVGPIGDRRTGDGLSTGCRRR
jgi:hypothetical protein